jgi:hypothetical protein
VSVAPGTANVFLGATQPFTASVTNTANGTVTWSVSGTGCAGAQCGTIDANGMYTAPQVMPMAAVVAVRATSVADPSRSSTAQVTIVSDVAVSVMPASPGVLLGATQQFNASVTATGNPNRDVLWSVNGVAGGNPMVGLITPTGFYTAPQILPSPASVTVTATSVADAAKAGSTMATISSGNLMLSISGPATVDNGTLAQFVVVITADPGAQPSTAVDWSVDGIPGGNSTVGTIDSAGRYVAPQLAPSPNMVTLRATSVADPSRSATFGVTINSIILVAIAPTMTNVALESTLDFAATVSGVADQRVTWEVDGIAGGTTPTGTITNPASGPTSPTTYTAPVNKPAAGQVTVRARSVADPSKTADAVVGFFSNITVSVQAASGNPSTRAVNRRETLSANLANSSNLDVTWTVNGIAGGNDAAGKICVAGFSPCQQITSPLSSTMSVEYQAPAAVPNPDTVLVTAVSQADASKSGGVTIRIVPTVQVSVFPAGATIAPGSTQQFFAAVLGTANQGVTWSLSGAGCGGGACGSITPQGLYTAPAVAPAPNSFLVTAASAEDPLQSGNGNVEIAIGPVIQTLRPSSFTAVPLSGGTLRVLGVNLVASNPGPGSEILVNGAARSTLCASTTECTLSLSDTDNSPAGDRFIQVRNPDLRLSNQVVLRVAAPDTTEDIIALTAGNPAATDKDIAVVESFAAAAGGTAPDIDTVGLLVNNNCSAFSASISVMRPAAGNRDVEICIAGDNLGSAVAVSLSGPTPNDAEILNLRNFGFSLVFTLKISSTTRPGPRTIFVETNTREKAVATGAIEVK